MRSRASHRVVAAAASLALAAALAAPTSAAAQDGALYRDATETHLPGADLEGLSMDAHLGDVDGDGDLDVLIANEHRPNILLINDGTGRFTNGSDRIPQVGRDSEEVVFADFDGDGDLDAISVSEDDRKNELYLNRGDGTFEDASDRLPVTGTSNAATVADLTGDGAPDVLIGNNGQNVFLVNDGDGRFRDETGERLPRVLDVTQDLALGDVDGDGDLDLVAANEDDNRLMLNDGSGHFEEASEGRIPYRDGPEETRQADLGDVDGDGDPDLFFANVRAFVRDADPTNRLLINDGTGHFTTAGTDRMPVDEDRSFGGSFVDVDGDGDPDVVTSNSDVNMERGRIESAPWRVYLNDGSGTFREATGEVFPGGTTGVGFDVEQADLDGDGLPDLFLSSRGTVDRLLLRAAAGG